MMLMVSSYMVMGLIEIGVMRTLLILGYIYRMVHITPDGRGINHIHFGLQFDCVFIPQELLRLSRSDL